MLSNRAIEVFRMMAEAENAEDYDEAEVVCDGATCWLGTQRLRRATLDALIGCAAVKFVSEPGSLERYVINGTGRAILDDPSVADRVLAAMSRGENVDEKGNPLPKV